MGSNALLFVAFIFHSFISTNNMTHEINLPSIILKLIYYLGNPSVLL